MIMGKEIVNLWGPGYIEDFIGGVRYQISPLSFYQVNRRRRKSSTGRPLAYAGLTGDEIVWDLYCGIGTISLFLAQKAGRSTGWRLCPGHRGRPKERRHQWHRKRGIFCGEGRGGASLGVRPHRGAGGRDRGGSALGRAATGCVWRRSLRWSRSGWCM